MTDFDRHRRVGGCVDLAELGLVEVAGLWASPERHADDARKATVLARARLRVAHTRRDGRSPVEGSSGGAGRDGSDPACGGAVAA